MAELTSLEKLHSLRDRLKTICTDLQINFTNRVEPIDPRDDQIHLTFTYDEEADVDRLIRAARISFAAFGPENWLSESHVNAVLINQSERISYHVYKSLITSHMYWGVSFILCGPDECYSMLEDIQP